MRSSYTDRCILKASHLLEELLEDYALGHIYKTIATFWEVIELLLRAIIYAKKKTTYEKPRKLINEYIRVADTPKGILACLNLLYELRKKVVHKALILKKESMELAKDMFCKVIKTLLRDIAMKDLYGIEEKIKNLCTD